MAAASKYLDPSVLNRLGNMELIARCAVQGFFSGLHPSPFHGFSVEYSDHRQYERGDDLRFLDWKVYGRTNKLCVKRFLQETNVPVYILLDSSNSMTFRGESAYSKLDYGSFLVAALSYLMLHQGDSVGLLTFAETIRKRIPARARRTHLHAILSVLQANSGSGQTRLAQVLHALAETTPRQGIVVLISDLLDDPDGVQSGLAHLKYLRHDVIVFHTLDKMELELAYDGLVQFEDLESTGRIRTFPESVRDSYREKVQAFIDDVKKTAGRSRIDYCLLDTSQPLDKAFMAYLAKRERMT